MCAGVKIHTSNWRFGWLSRGSTKCPGTGMEGDLLFTGPHVGPYFAQRFSRTTCTHSCPSHVRVPEKSRLVNVQHQTEWPNWAVPPRDPAHGCPQDSGARMGGRCRSQTLTKQAKTPPSRQRLSQSRMYRAGVEDLTTPPWHS